jgi:cation:H+ antiporter
VSSLAAVALLVAGVVVIVAGAEIFFDGLLTSASRLRTSPFVVAVLLSGLELENLAAGIAANAKGLSGAAAGTFLGGTTFLALAVGGIAALAAPIRADLPRPVIGWTLAAPIPLALLALDRELSRLDGALLLLWFSFAIIAMARSGRSLLGPAAERERRRRRPLLRLAGGLALLTLGGELLGEGVRRAASHFEVSGTLLGNTVVAASVEAEEVARVSVPSRRGRADVGLANITGTIVHFVALNAGVIALVKPLRLDSDTLHLHLPVAIAATAALCALLATRGGISRRSGALLLSLYGLYLVAAIAIGV